MESTIKQRIKQFCNEIGISVKAFEEHSNLSNGYVNGISKSIGDEKLKTISLSFPQLNITWLLTGEGEMLKEPVGDEAEAEPTLGELARMIADHDRRFHDQMERIMDAMGIEKTVKKERTA